MIYVILYIIIAALATFALYVTAVKWACYDVECDSPWPVLSGILWPVVAPIAAAYIAARWFLDNYKGD